MFRFGLLLVAAAVALALLGASPAFVAPFAFVAAWFLWAPVRRVLWNEDDDD